jgi:hypothetical protein
VMTHGMEDGIVKLHWARNEHSSVGWLSRHDDSGNRGRLLFLFFERSVKKGLVFGEGGALCGEGCVQL